MMTSDPFSKDVRSYLMGLAIIGVVMVHVSTQEVDHPIYKIISLLFSKGHLGVNVFFLLSSYGLCYSYNNNNLKRFYINRLYRIWSIFPVALIARYFVNSVPLKDAFVRFFYEISGLFLFQVKRDFFWYMGVLTILYPFSRFYMSYSIDYYKISVLLLLCLLSHVLVMFDFGFNDIYLYTISRIPTSMS